MTTIIPEAAAAGLITDDMLARFDERAPRYDRDNEFFTEDFDELRASGYFTASLPTEYGVDRNATNYRNPDEQPRWG